MLGGAADGAADAAAGPIALRVTVGSLAFEEGGAGELVSCTRLYGAGGALQRVELRTVFPDDTTDDANATPAP